jgi:CheY-like chemotaxis protein
VEALETAALGPRPFDAVLMDVMMPGLDGLEAARRIRALPGPERRVPILAVTASAFAEDIAACREAGMDAHLAKPIEREALLAALVDLVRAAAPGMALPVARPRPRAFEVPGLDAAATKALAAAFLAEMGEAAAALAAAGSPAEVVPAAHRLAGAAATLEAMRLAEAARQLQREAAGLDPAVLAERRAALLVLVAEALALFEPEPAA